MIGVIFTELLTLIEDEFSYETVDKILRECRLDSDGVYTNVGAYSHEEFFKIVIKLSEISDIKIDSLLSRFGNYLFPKLMDSHKSYIKDITDSFELLTLIDSYIHVEVYKLYPNAQLPEFNVENLSEQEMELHYKSERKLASFAEGMLHGCGQYFKEDYEITRYDQKGDSSDVIFHIRRYSHEP